MSSTTSLTAASQVQLSPEHLGICRGADDPVESLEVANQLLQRNHDEHHIFWRDNAGHNHTVHNVLTRLALGASPSELQLGFHVNLPGQRPKPGLDNQAVREMSDEGKFYERLGQSTQYTNFLVFFEKQIEEKGWRAVVNEYCFRRTRNADALLARLYDGAFHPIIHLGLGVEFEQPGIIAEALAQAATDNTVGIEVFFLKSEQEALKSDPVSRSKTLAELIHEARANDAIRCAARWDDFGVKKMSDGVLGRAGREITNLAAQFRVKPEALERRTAEMINCCAYFAGAAQRPGKARKIDFFYMHDVTSSIFLTVLTRQPWIGIENKVRLVEWKSRMDLVWYATCGAAELRIEDARDYAGTSSADMDWTALFRAVNKMHDDGHVGKFVRALKNGEEVSKPFEHGEGAEAFPIKGETWLKVARMAYDSTVNLPPEEKWVVFAGFDEAWENVPVKE